MADEADLSEEQSAVHLENTLRNISLKAAAIPKGEPGECEKCGEESPRLVRGVCARCRDKYKLP